MRPAVRIRLAALGLACLAASLAPARGAAPQPVGFLSATSDSAHPIHWTGVASLAPGGAAENTFQGISTTLGQIDQRIVAQLGGARSGRVTVWIRPAGSATDFAMRITTPTQSRVCPDGTQSIGGSACPVASSDAPAGDDEIGSFTAINGGIYDVHVIAKSGGGALGPAAYDGFAWVRSLAGTNTGNGAHLRYDKPNACGDLPKVQTIGTAKYSTPPPPCYFPLNIPINVVMVGYDRSEVDPETGDLLGSLPSSDLRAPTIKPVIMSESGAGGSGLLSRDGGSTARQGLFTQGTSMSYLPFGYKYSYHVTVASERYSRDLFAAAKSFTTSGDYAHPQDRAYLEAYNARASALRRAHPVLPHAPVDFIDAMKLEDWIAAHPPAKGITYNASKPSAGYTFFVLDTYRPTYAGEYFNLAHYHSFRVMNSLTTDPDTGVQHGFDWGRTWGGRYRFLMIDTGAAPNSFEGSTQRRAAPYRTAFDGDSAATDPPVWEYAGCQSPVDCRDLIPTYYQHLGEDLLSGVMLRFTPGYASRPRADDRYVVASQTWADAGSYSPWATDVSKLYKPQVVAAQLRSLLPTATIDSRSAVRYLSAADEQQAALDEGRTRSRDGLPDSTRTSPQRVMWLVEQKRAAYAPSPKGTTSIPVVNVIHPGPSSWSSSDETGSVVTTTGQDGWGVFNGLNDVTKPSMATGGVTDSAGVRHTSASDPRGESPAAQSGFTASTLRLIGRALGLFPATEGIMYQTSLPATVQNPRPGTPADPQEQWRSYFHTVDWTWATTATPMTSGWFYGRFEILDKDAIGRAHAMDWLDRSLDDVSDAFAALDARGYRSPPAVITSKILYAGKFIGGAVGAMIQGFNADAVKNARGAKRETEKLVTLALAQRRAPR